MMKQTAMDTDVFYLPPEIIRNILKRLPVKSLIRFQCACRYWKNLIQSQSFIADHLQQSHHQNPSLLLEHNVFNIPFYRRLHLLDFGLQIHCVQKAPLIDSFKGANIVGSCNGLLCLEICQSYQSPPPLSLWNPATTAVRHLPRTKTDFFHFDEFVTGFGFSPTVNDYKIVRTYAEFDDAVNWVEVFSLSRGIWKVIDIGNLRGVILNPQTVTTGGAIFWSGVKLGADGEGEDNVKVEEGEVNYMDFGENEVEVIVSFDLAKEVFTLIPKPDFCIAVEKLTVYENKLAILVDIWEDDDETPDLIELWVLDGGTCASGETWSWTKRYTSKPISCTLDLMTIWRDEIVCKPISEGDNEKGRRNVLCMKNLYTNEEKRIFISYCGPICSVYNYVESLVLVGNNNNYIEQS